MTIFNEYCSLPLQEFHVEDMISPIVSFTGPIIGSGHTLLHCDAIPCIGNDQLKCCGFIQLSTFLSPGNPDKTPFKGFHPFQVFIIFPIQANPWSLLCKRMVEKKETYFRSNTLLSCTGKVAGFLDHRIMVHPPQLSQDYVFVVVPDTWKFHDNTGQDSISTLPIMATQAKEPSTDPFDMANFISPSKLATQQPTTPIINTASPTTPALHLKGSEDLLPWC
jgi:hypothetical protein